MYIQAGYTPEEAEEKAFTIDFIRRNPEAPDITYSAISNYTEHCEPVSISVSTYYDAWKFCSNIESDGTRGNVKNQYVEYITSLPISFAQQKALWLALKNTTWRDSGTPFA